MEGEKTITAEFPTEVVSIFQELNDRLEKLDISIDYLAAAITGEDPASIAVAQAVGGRLASPNMARKNIPRD